VKAPPKRRRIPFRTRKDTIPAHKPLPSLIPPIKIKNVPTLASKKKKRKRIREKKRKGRKRMETKEKKEEESRRQTEH
jgi:hypothetical protein